MTDDRLCTQCGHPARDHTDGRVFGHSCMEEIPGGRTRVCPCPGLSLEGQR